MKEKLLAYRSLTSVLNYRFDALYAIYRDSIAPREQKSKAELSAMVSKPHL